MPLCMPLCPCATLMLLPTDSLVLSDLLMFFFSFEWKDLGSSPGHAVKESNVVCALKKS